ncbi:MAG: ATP-binding protein [Nitrospirae bacterium]|nr:ATP-binding protein [Nitrospirota bacterium]MCL5976899.1 ATP-binding protein [Nitrospirota bacterium]
MTYLLIIILSIAIIFLAARLTRISMSIKEISYFLKELSAGNFNARLFPTGKGDLAGVVRDIASIMEETKTRLDFAEAEMRRMEAILRGMSDGVLIADERGTIILVNQAFRDLMSSAKDIEGKQMVEVLRNMQLVEVFRKAMDSGDIISEEIIVSKPHRDMYLIATAVPVYSRNMISGAVLTLHDITRLRQLEEMRKDFVANVSHEIKTPITAIKGFAETLLDGALEDKENATRFLRTIKGHSERLNSLVDDLLTLSRIELGDITIKKASVNPEQIVDTVFMTLREKADKKGLYLKKSIAAGIQEIHADKDRLIQIILNLVDNGIKFTEKGGVTVGMDYSGGRLVLYVQDTGVGIPKSHLHRLGERFYRVDRTRSRELGGTGLGLAIVKHLVNAHEWNMWIESEPGRGTKVNITIDRYL